MLRQTPRNTLVRELDRLCRQVVFERDRNTCRWCKAKPATDWAHVMSRRYHALRWDLDNSFAACKGCHLKWHHQPVEAVEWWKSEIGESRYEALRIRLKTRRKLDLKAVQLDLARRLA